MLLNEAYYGKDSILLECEKQIHILRTEAGTIAKDKNSHPANKKLQQLLAKKFNVQDVIISWIPNLTVNAYTHPITFMLDVTTEDIRVVRDGKSGVKFKNPKGKIMTISVFDGLASLPEFTDGEIMAIILHEIGHNFFVLQHTFILSKINFLLNALQKLLQEMKDKKVPTETVKELIQYGFFYAKPGRLVQKVIADGLTHNPKFSGVNNILKAINLIASFIIKIVTDVVTIVTMPGMLLLAPVVGVVTTPLFFIKELMSAGYANEKFADNFATSYGYGADSVSSEQKMNNHAKTHNIVMRPLSETPAGRIYNICHSFNMFFLHLGDPHPMSMTRVNDQIRMLEKELNKTTISPKQKEIIKKDIAKMKQIQETMTDVSNKVGVEFMNGFIQSSFGGDPREVFLKTTDYDKRDNEVFGWREDVDLDYFMNI